jgi:HSP20 family protein
MFRTMFPVDLLSELDRIQRSAQRFAGSTSSIRGFGYNEFPALNVGGTLESVEIYAFAPGMDPKSFDVTIERGVLSLSGERSSELPTQNAQISVHMNERYAGRFQRAVSLSDDVDPNRVTANYNDGVLHISVKRRESAQPRRIEVH